MPEVAERVGAPLRWARRSASVASAIACMALSSGAEGAELHVTAPTACLDAQELDFRVERALGRPVAEVAPLRVNVAVERARTLLSARIEMVDESAGTRAERVVGGRDCEDLSDAITVVIALALDSTSSSTVNTSGAPPLERAAQHETATEAGASSNAAAQAAAPIDGSAESATADGQKALVPAVSIWVVGDTGSLPAPALGLSLGVELAADYWQVRALGTLLVDQQRQLEAAGTAGAELRLASGALLGCLIPTRAPSLALQVRACAGWELGQLSGAGTGVAAPRTRASLWSAPLADLGLFWALPATRLHLGALLVLAMPLGRDEFVLGELGHVHRPASFVGRAMIGAAFALD